MGQSRSQPIGLAQARGNLQSHHALLLSGIGDTVFVVLTSKGGCSQPRQLVARAFETRSTAKQLKLFSAV
jgi:hypothetical protein